MLAHNLTEGLRLRDPLSPAEMEDLMVYLLRSGPVRNQAVSMLSPQHFDPEKEAHYAALWKTVQNMADRYPNSLNYRAVRNEVLRELRARGDEIDLSLQADLISEPRLDRRIGFLYHAFQVVQDHQLDSRYGIDLLQQFLTDRAVSMPLRSLFYEADRRVPLNLTDVLDQARTSAAMIQASQSNPRKAFLPDDWAPQKIVGLPTGLGFIDRPLQGGQVPGEIFTVLGPYGGGKTTLAIQLAIESAKLFQRVALETGEPLRHVHYFGYEDGEEMYRARAHANAAEIPRDTLEASDGWAGLSSTGALKGYEVEMYNRRNTPDAIRFGERERLQAAGRLLNPNFHIMDMRNDAGWGGIPEIVALLEQDQQQEIRPGLVIVDYIGAVVKRQVDSAQGKGDPRSAITLGVNSFPMMAKQRIGAKFNVPVWLMHQYSAPSNKRTAGSKMHHTDSADGRAVGENSDFCLCLGTRDPQTHVFMAEWTKGRRTAAFGQQLLLQMEGAFARLRDASSEFVLDPVGGIQPASMVAEIQDGQTVRPGQRPRPTRGGATGDSRDILSGSM